MPDPFMPDNSTSRPLAAAPGAAMDRATIRQPRPWRRLRLPAAATALAAAAWFGWRLVPASDTLDIPTTGLAIATVANAPFQDYLPVRGTIAPLHSVYLDAVQGGQVKSVAVQDGARLAAGQVLATLSNPQTELDVSSRAASIEGQLGTVSNELLTLQQGLATERASIAATSYDLLRSRRDLSIRQELHNQGFESDAGVKSFADEATYYNQRLSLLRAAYASDAALARHQIAEITDTQARLHGNLADVEASLQALTITAPLPGQLTDFDLQPGQAIKAGDRIGEIDSLDAFRIDADIDEFYLGRVDPGQPATASIDNADTALRVARVRPRVTNGSFRAELEFTATPPPGLRRGETADLRITLGATQSAVVVPNGPWLQAGGGNTIFVLDATTRHATRRAITSGRRNPEQVEILAGLAAGERVVTSAPAGAVNFRNLLIQQGNTP